MTLFARLTLAMALIASCSTVLADGVTPFGDVLYWHASAETSSVWSNAAYPHSSFSAENTRFDWNPGFRVGFGHQLDEQSWDVKLYWTYFRTSQDTNVSIGNADTDAVVPEFFSGFVGGGGLFSQGSLDWSLTYNLPATNVSFFNINCRPSASLNLSGAQNLHFSPFIARMRRLHPKSSPKLS
jgi:hypothetical protein